MHSPESDRFATQAIVKPLKKLLPKMDRVRILQLLTPATPELLNILR
jgi:hypothetical protein